MEFDELYATHGNSACKAAETFQLRNRGSCQGMVSGFRIFHRTGFAEEPNGIRIASFFSQLHPPFVMAIPKILRSPSICWSYLSK